MSPRSSARRSLLPLALALCLSTALTAQATPTTTSADPSRWFNLRVRGAPSARLAGSALIIDTQEQPGAIWAALGPYLPDSVRIEATITQSGCAVPADARSGIAFANTGRNDAHIIEFKGSGEAMLIQMGTIGISKRGPAYAAGVARKVAVEIAGPTAVVFVDGAEIARETWERPMSGAFGIVAGGQGCETRYDDMRVIFKKGIARAVAGPAVTRDGLAMLDTNRITERTSGVVSNGTITFTAPQGTLSPSRGDALLGAPLTVEATFQQPDCMAVSSASIGIAVGSTQDRPFALLEIVNQQWSLRTLGGTGIAGQLPPGLYKVGEPVRLAVTAVGNVLSASVNGTTIGAADLGRPFDGRFGVIRSGCTTTLTSLRVSAQ